MAQKQITFGDIYRLLKREGFVTTARFPAEGLAPEFIRYNLPTSRAAIVLPKQKSAAHPTPLNLISLRMTMIDFGVMTTDAFELWLANPRQYQTA